MNELLEIFKTLVENIEWIVVMYTVAKVLKYPAKRICIKLGEDISIETER